MQSEFEREAVKQLREVLSEPFDDLAIQLSPKGPDSDREIDLVAESKGIRFAVELKKEGTIAQVAGAIEGLKHYKPRVSEDLVRLVVVPFMTPAAQELCRKEGVSWLDLSGNAHLKGPGVFIHIEGNPNRFTRRGRPSNLFAPKSSRVVRRLLMDPHKWSSHSDLVEATGISTGLVSRVLQQLKQESLILRDDAGRAKVSNPNLLLEAWYEAYDFKRHTIVVGHVAERTSQAVLKRLSEAFTANDLRHAATGLAGAWLLTQFASFRTVTMYVEHAPSPESLREIGFSEQAKGGNVWLVVPNDESVFEGAAVRSDEWCAHPIQVYLDLKAHPERAKEAAEMLRKHFLDWRADV